MSKRSCIFCGAKPVTREHVFGQWIQRLASIQEPKEGSITYHTPGDVKEAIFEAPPLGRTARVVCETCNSGWMSKLEHEAAQVLTPLFHGRSMLLSSQDLEVLSKWAFKTGFVIDAASLGTGAQTPEADRHRLRENLQLPSLSSVWMTSWPGTSTTWTQHWGLATSETNDALPTDVNTYGATIALFPIIFRTYATSVPAIHPDQFRETVPGISKIWPAAGPFEWKAVFWLSAQQLEDFAFGIPRAIERSYGGDHRVAFWEGEESAPIRGPQ